jgi:uncharacterized membrane protein YeaQ/YmgE (transglycosylase-associated protein family)
VSPVLLILTGMLLLSIAHRPNWRHAGPRRIDRRVVFTAGLGATVGALAAFVATKGAELGITHWLLWAGVGAMAASLLLGRLKRSAARVVPLLLALVVVAAIVEANLLIGIPEIP